MSSLPWRLHLDSEHCVLLHLACSSADGKSPVVFSCRRKVPWIPLAVSMQHCCSCLFSLTGCGEFPPASCVWFDFEAGRDELFSCFSLLVVSSCLSHRAFFLATLHARSFTFCEPESHFLGGVIRQLLISCLGWVARPGVGKNRVSPHRLRSLPSFRGLHVRSVYRSESGLGSSGMKGTVRV